MFSVFIGVGVNRDGGDAHLFQRADDTHRDSAAVGDKNSGKHNRISGGQVVLRGFSRCARVVPQRQDYQTATSIGVGL
ncbi:hypothetical protein BN135_2319 [Cronobacter muytjensii 530]